MEDIFNGLIYTMIGLAIVVFISLYFVTAGYGQFRTKQWGWSINNKLAWVLMEAPAFLTMLVIWYTSGCPTAAPQIVLLGLFLLHYFQRSFIFPLLMSGHSKMPVTIMLSGVTFNIINGIMQGGALFWFPREAYLEGWDYFTHDISIMGLVIFFIGMAINLHSDHVIRHLRQPGDTRHYLPQKGMYQYVTSANYFGEIVEWTGFAIVAGSLAAWVFVWWTAANLVPRAHAIYNRYKKEFGKEALAEKKRIIPFIY
jgi:3-oxo-5-alpha-steroid 4-dehydrogenase 1